MTRMQCFTLVLLVLACLSGCRSLVEQTGTGRSLAYRDPSTGIVVKNGRRAPIIDGLGWVVGVPTKLALWDSRADDHDVSSGTVGNLLQYMDANGLNDVEVSVNRYDPLSEWKRLSTNQRISPGWRYTVGLYNHLEYTLLPGRIIGGDWYNPFTDTVHIYSDVTPLTMARVAYAKDVRTRQQPGIYAATQELPIVGMLHETLANQDVLSYARENGTVSQHEEAERILFPDYGSSWGGQIASFFPLGTSIGRLVGAGVGHATNAVQNAMTHNGHELVSHSNP